jgi:sterol desaturase/sphingolipid hydroxylase (fatty acid hydroxylase superfamily)
MFSLNDFYYSFFNLTTVFSLSTLTAYVTCVVFKQPFINPIYTTDLIYTRAKEAGNTVVVVLSQAVITAAFFIHKIESENNHTWFQTGMNMCLYGLCIEFIYYIYHRSAHSNTFLYQKIHKQHHVNHDVYPFDTFYLTTFDSLGLIVSLGLPLTYLPVTYFELNTVLYIYLTSSYLSHSKLFYDHHHIHHSLLKCNYCILVPIFDILFQTYR